MKNHDVLNHKILNSLISITVFRWRESVGKIYNPFPTSNRHKTTFSLFTTVNLDHLKNYIVIHISSALTRFVATDNNCDTLLKAGGWCIFFRGLIGIKCLLFIHFVSNQAPNTLFTFDSYFSKYVLLLLTKSFLFFLAAL